MNSVLTSIWGFGPWLDERSTSLLGVASGNAFCICHPDRSAKGLCSSKKPSSAEWRDPGEVSSTMLPQGVLPKLPIAARDRGENVRACHTSALLFNSRTYRRRTKARGRFLGRTPWGRMVRDTLPGSLHCALEVFCGARASWRSGRDDKRTVPRIEETPRRSSCSFMRDVA